MGHGGAREGAGGKRKDRGGERCDACWQERGSAHASVGHTCGRRRVERSGWQEGSGWQGGGGQGGGGRSSRSKARVLEARQLEIEHERQRERQRQAAKRKSPVMDSVRALKYPQNKAAKEARKGQPRGPKPKRAPRAVIVPDPPDPERCVFRPRRPPRVRKPIAGRQRLLPEAWWGRLRPCRASE